MRDDVFVCGACHCDGLFNGFRLVRRWQGDQVAVQYQYGASFFILAFFLVFGSTIFAFKALFVGMWDYVLALPSMSMTVWSGDGDAESVASKLAGWQGG